ncbi:hypothetical protein [Allorhizobium taibaishanense]|uniref:Uncharacterized protein n=1 Tax=Allorhizobium taibaishanense TaxID=887144 RepID=A0A1Q9A4G4_9HYPH|nr:hypothetical protein [Allorhizobium taibaishanense]MBB4006489.1 hypothetical protein [Allorhizobium taibaishanense]OLP49426.1 hypothetical protein BJF91_20520 [Allorhizobium taibaishanense]
MTTYYRLGNFTPMNFTPRDPQDLQGYARGLSVSTTLPLNRAQMLDDDTFTIVSAIATPTANDPNHHSVRPTEGGNVALTQWAQTRAALADDNSWDNPAVSNYSNDLYDSRTGQVN